MESIGERELKREYECDQNTNVFRIRMRSEYEYDQNTNVTRIRMDEKEEATVEFYLDDDDQKKLYLSKLDLDG